MSRSSTSIALDNFQYAHLAKPLRTTAKPFANLALKVADGLVVDQLVRLEVLAKLAEAKDLACREALRAS